jgi:2-polyprenyl-6-methoxyphenol hydroxylase-like FAD-dependent oxidoreductase
MVTPVLRTPVLVVGAGLTGCLLALELAHHGVSTVVLERAARPPRHPDLTMVDGRSVELLRRLGVAGRVRASAVDPACPVEVLWSRRLDQAPVHISNLPSPDELRRAYAVATDEDTLAEPYLLVTSADLTSALLDAVRAQPLIELRTGWTCTDLRQEPGGTVATALDAETGVRHLIEADYLAGCDGAHSTVRRCLGVPVDEQEPVAHHLSIAFHYPLPTEHPGPTMIVAGGITLTRRYSTDPWVAQVPLGGTERDQDGYAEGGKAGDEAAATDPARLLRDRLGIDLDGPDLLGVTQWDDGLGVAGHFRRGTAFLAGQSAHRFHPPSSRVDTCIGDAVDLGWKLAAAVRGWAGPALLASYEDERRQRALLDREVLVRAMETRRRFGRLAAAGASADFLARFVLQEPPQLDPGGSVNSGAYPRSPVLWQERPIPRPGRRGVRLGVRPPAVRLAGGEPLLDRLGPQFTLVDLTDGAAGKPLVAAAEERGIPMTYFGLADASVRASWSSRLVLIRPDQHVAWHADRSPSDWEAVLDVVTGRRPQNPVNT